jgi:hypothetical protein
MEELEQAALRGQAGLEGGDGAIEVRIVAPIFDHGAGVTHAGAIAAQCASAGRKTGVIDDMMKIEGELPRLRDSRASASGGRDRGG